jgi:glycerophosphoryl diester phosphodiesterase
VRHEGVAPASLAVQDLPAGAAWTVHAAPSVTPIAHRGGAAYAPENTVAAIRTAALMGAKAVEFDVQLTLDREPVLFHDLELDRTTNGSGLVGLHTLAELRALDAGSWFGADYAGEPIPTLAEALAEVKAWGLTAVLELKPGRVSPTGGAHLEIPTDALIFERSAQVAGEVNLTLGQIIYTSFGMAGSHACGRFSPAACGWIISKELDRGQEEAIMPAVSGVDVLVLHHSHVDAGRVQRIHASCDYLAHASTCPSVIAYTVNGVVGLLAMAAAGVDGVVTDKLDVAYGVLASA